MTKKSCGCGDESCVEGISCAVKGCVFHDGERKCMAGSIAVGPENACCSSETVCATFRPKADRL